MDKPIVVVGAGVAGLTVAEMLAENGFRCVLVEREISVGGHVRDWPCMATDRCARCLCCSVEHLAGYVIASDKVRLLTGWELASIVQPGNGGRQVHLRRVGSGEEKIEDASAVVIATGFELYDPREKTLWGHGRMDGVYTLAEVNSLLRDDKLSQFTNGCKGLRVAFFQCVGSRDANSGANYCSQHCCKSALRMALKLVYEYPELEVTIFYIDLQISGKYSGTLLKEALERGVNLRQGVPGEITNLEGRLEVIVESQGINRREEFDRVILSIGQRPHPVRPTVDRLGLSEDDFGFIRSKSPLDSSRTGVEGVYVAGTSCGPKDIERTLEHAGQTAEAIIADLRKGTLK